MDIAERYGLLFSAVALFGGSLQRARDRFRIFFREDVILEIERIALARHARRPAGFFGGHKFIATETKEPKGTKKLFFVPFVPFAVNI
jgi:hypothetical protein